MLVLSLDREGAFIVTGGNRGVGFSAAKILLNRGHSVIILSRNHARGEVAVANLIRLTGNRNCTFNVVDLCDFKTILDFAREVEKKNIAVASLINNAGMIARDSMTPNHLGHFALTLALLPALRRGRDLSGNASIVNVASVAHLDGSLELMKFITKYNDINPSISLASGCASLESTSPGNIIDSSSMQSSTDSRVLSLLEDTSSWSSYTASKAANVAFSLALGQLLETEGIRVTSLHPGVMLTDLWRSPNEHQKATDGGGDAGRETLRWLSCCCVKIPQVAAIGLTSLASPRLPYRVCCYPMHALGGTQTLGNITNTVQRYLFTGSNGGYYQQCLCCCIVPVRASPLVYEYHLQNDLWKASFEYIRVRNNELYEYVMTNSASLGPKLNGERQLKPRNLPRRLHVSPATPCSECLTIAPYCVCLACIC